MPEASSQPIGTGGIDEQEVARIHAVLDRAGVPSAEGHICNDPECNSKIGHRVRVLVARLKVSVAALKDAKDYFEGSPYATDSGEELRIVSAAIAKAEGRDEA